MSNEKLTLDIIAVVTGSAAIIGFVSTWIKLGVSRGEQKKSMELLEEKTNKHEKEIADFKNSTHRFQLDLANSMGKIEVKLNSIEKIEKKLDSISDQVAALKGGRRAAEKQN
jgi:septal ring factor EnvC (AmiA/AmiB activator)